MPGDAGADHHHALRRIGASAATKSTSSGRPTRGLFTQAIGTCIITIAPQQVLQDRQ